MLMKGSHVFQCKLYLVVARVRPVLASLQELPVSQQPNRGSRLGRIGCSSRRLPHGLMPCRMPCNLLILHGWLRTRRP
eukprot:569186-Pyramimonas_sp.AAC.1